MCNIYVYYKKATAINKLKFKYPDDNVTLLTDDVFFICKQIEMT